MQSPQLARTRRSTYDPISLPLASHGPDENEQENNMKKTFPRLTGLLNMSLLETAARPPFNLGAFARRLEIPLMDRGPERVAICVSATLSGSVAVGGDMMFASAGFGFRI